jgi:hypothetical protein
MHHRAILVAAALFSAFPAVASPSSSVLLLQDSAASQSPAPPKPADQESQTAATSSAERKKNKKVWTNDDLGEARGSAISLVGDANNGSHAKNAAATKPASSQEIAGYRKQLTALQAQLISAEKQLADLKSFRKGEAPGANGLQMHKAYTMEPVEDQVRKLEEKRKVIAAQMDALLDAARKRGIEPGQLR